MSEIAIRCEGLSKQYRIGEQERYKALRDVISDAAAAPFRRLRTAFSNVDSKLETPIGNRQSAIENGFIWALDEVSFEIERGEVVGIIGPNGAGKSTLLKILSRITKPTRGHAEIHGRVGSLLEVGTGFHPELTGRENIYLNGAILGMRNAEIERKFDEIVGFAEVEKFIDTPVKRYSTGMYVRLAFAVAAHMEPEILVIDEVLAVGDATFQRKCLGKMDEVAKHGRTLLFVSHDINAIQALCPRTIHLEAGQIRGMGDTSIQIASYLSASKRRSQITAEAPVMLGGKLEIRRFEFMPNPVEVGHPTDFRLDLFAADCIRLDDLAVLVYSQLKRRVAIIDLRSPTRSYKFDGENVISISGTVKSIPLVDGEYSIGLYLNWGEHKGNFHDLVDLSVKAGAKLGQLVPYAASARGIVELQYTFS